jgi:hypothetical protein
MLFKDKLINIMVSKFQNEFTAPDIAFMVQDENPWETKHGEDD